MTDTTKKASGTEPNVSAPINSGNTSTQRINRSPNADPVDDIFYSIFQQRVEQDKKHKSKTFVGLCLGFESITTDQCIIETSEEFYQTIDKDYVPYTQKPIQIAKSYELERQIRDQNRSEITDALDSGQGLGDALAAGLERKLGNTFDNPASAAANSDAVKALEEKRNKKTKQLYRARVYIPEMMGFLPMLTEREIKQYNDYVKTPPPANTKQEENFQYYKRTLDRIPVFYSLADNPPQLLKKAKVEFPDQTYMFYGKYLGTV